MDWVRVLSIGRNPIQVLLIWSDPVRVLAIRSDPDFVNACMFGIVGGEGRGILLNEKIYNVRELYLHQSHDFC